MKNSGLLILLLIVVVLVLIFVRRHYKKLVLPNVFLVTGAVKSGKSFLSVSLAISTYKKNVRNYKIKKFVLHIFNKEITDLEPMLYSNIPLARTKYNPLTKDIVLQKVRIPSKSVVLIDEASLLADSMLFNDANINNALLRFVKLFAHYGHGSTLIVDTQSVSDLHFAFKRCISSYLYIYSRKKLPFITIMSVREMMYSEDNSLISVTTGDIELTMRRIVVFNSCYKKYDCYCYSIFTDDLQYQVDYEHKLRAYSGDLKAYTLVSFQKFTNEVNARMNTLYLLDEKGELIQDEE